MRIGTGRDAADTAFATVFGAAKLNNMDVYIENLNGQSGESESDCTAYANVST